MTTVATRVRAISDLEGFDIIVMQGNDPVDVSANGVLNGYAHERKMKHTKTVNEWRNERFTAAYPGYWCKVLDGDGNEVAGQMLLRTLRETYEEG